MPRPMLKTPQQIESQSPLSATRPKEDSQRKTQMDKMKLARLLRKKRSPEYMEAMRQLDAGGHVHNQEKVNRILDIIRDEFPEVELHDILLGFVSVCYLGKPYEVHTLDFSGQIIHHYKVGEILPNGMEKARGIALRGGYEFIEVYTDCCRAVSANGSVAVISC